MFWWYQKSKICYACLSDVPDLDPVWRLDLTSNSFQQAFTSSRWFTRGWTLQELLAPRIVQFFSRGWKNIRCKHDDIVTNLISKTTGIEVNYLVGDSSLGSASIACKMSWLSRRKTTRREDMAYCMLGLFEINMPLLYGEGDKAFVRLQEEILKSSSDHTLFCWTWTDSVPVTWTSMLAPSPQVFESSGYFVESHAVGAAPVPYQMTNYGLSITLPYIQCWSYGFLMLNARESPYKPGGFGDFSFTTHTKLCIPVRARGSKSGIFNREPFPRSPTPFPVMHSRLTKHVIIRNQPDTFPIDRLHLRVSSGTARYGFLVSIQDTLALLGNDNPYYKHWEVSAGNRELQNISRRVHFESFPQGSFDTHNSIFWLHPRTWGWRGLLRVGQKNSSYACLLYFGVHDGNARNTIISDPWVCLALSSAVLNRGDINLEDLLRKLGDHIDNPGEVDRDWISESLYQVKLGPVTKTISGEKVRIISVVDKTIVISNQEVMDEDHDISEEASDVSALAIINGPKATITNSLLTHLGLQQG